MSSIRLGRSLILQATRSSRPRAARQFVAPPRAVAQVAIVPKLCFRFYSQEAAPRKIYSFEDVKSFVEKPNSHRILVDSREAAELQATGTIPGSLNIPVTSKPDSFFITAEKFEDIFGFERPSKDHEIVFYCRSGVRSRAAAELARQAGWSNVAEYQGSWMDWEKNGGAKQDAGR